MKYVILIGYDPKRRAHSFNRLRSRCQPIDILSAADYDDEFRVRRIEYIITHNEFEPEVNLEEQNRLIKFKSYNPNAIVITEQGFLNLFDQSIAPGSKSTNKSRTTDVRSPITTTSTNNEPRTTNSSDSETIYVTVSGYGHGKTTSACTRLRRYPVVHIIQQHEIESKESLIENLQYIITPDDFDVDNNPHKKSKGYIAKCLSLNPPIKILSEGSFIK
jgi:hypothetical protein